MQSLGPLRPKAALDIVVDPEIPLDKVVEITDDLVGVFVEQPLELAHLLIIIEVLLVLGVQLIENGMVVPQSLDQFLSTPLLGKR